jgi:hypothetical protein
MLAIDAFRFVLRPALVAAVGVLAATGLAVAQDISVGNGSNAFIPGTYVSGTYGFVGVTGTSTLTVDAPLTVTGGMSVTDSSTLFVNTDVTLSSTTSAAFYSNGSLVLHSGTFGGVGSYLYLGGATAFQRAGGRYIVDNLAIDGVAVDFVAGDSIFQGLAIYSGASFTIKTNLTFNGTAPANNGLLVSGSGSVFQRNNGATLTAPVVYADAEGAIQTLPGDTLTNALLFATAGGSITNSGTQAVRYVEIDGANSAITTTAPLRIDDGDPLNEDLKVLNGGRFDANADVTVGQAIVDGGMLNLLSGTASAASLVVISGSLSREANAAYDVETIFLQKTSMNFLAGDAISLLTLGGTATFITGPSLASLQLKNLTIDPTSTLILGSFDGTDAAETGWGLKVDGNQESQIVGYVTGSRIVGSGSQALSVLYNASSNATYVTAVPEPSTLALVTAGGLLAGWRSMWRRRTAA